MVMDNGAESRVYLDQLVWGVLLGVLGAAGAFVFVAITTLGIKLLYPEPPRAEPFSGSWHIVVIMTVAGLIVGLLHHFLPVKEEAVFEAVAKGWVDPRPVPSSVLVATVSLIGGFSLGPEVPTGRLAAGLATWISERRKLPAALRQANVLAAVTGTFGGLFTAPMAGVLIGLELGCTPARPYSRALLSAFPAAVAGFALFYGMQGSQFSPLLRFLDFAPYTLELWHLGVAILLGLVGAALALVFGVIRRVA